MSESLIVKDGNGTIKSLQVNSGSNGYISNHTIVSTVTASQVSVYRIEVGDNQSPFIPDWEFHSGSTKVADYHQRKGIIINNNSSDAKCYIYVGGGDAVPSELFEVTDVTKEPLVYTFCLEAGSTYFGDAMTSNLEHYVYVPSSSILSDPEAFSLAVTQIY